MVKRGKKSNREIILDRLFAIATGEIDATDISVMKAIELYCKFSGEFEHADMNDEQLVIVVGDLNKLDTSNLKGGPDDWVD
jgi:uncharacterized protein Smg (DUF494 family)